MSAFATDLLVIAAHPDDAELHCGGLMASMSDAGRKVVLLDATRGEFATRGTPEERAEESTAAAKILGVARENLALPDGHLDAHFHEVVRACVQAIRARRPRLVCTHAPGDHHPDHDALSRAVKQAFFLAGVLKFETESERHFPQRLLYFWGHRHLPAHPIAFVADVSNAFARKMAALECYKSQFHNPAYKGPATFVSSELAWEAVHSRSAFYGSLIGTRHGEPFLSETPLRIDDPAALPG